MIYQLSESTSGIINFKISGKIYDEEYADFISIIGGSIEKYGKVKLLIEFIDFDGWGVHALWNDSKFANKYRSAVTKIALVGDSVWHKWMSAVCEPFTMSSVKYFEQKEYDEAISWIRLPLYHKFNLTEEELQTICSALTEKIDHLQSALKVLMRNDADVEVHKHISSTRLKILECKNIFDKINIGQENG